MDDRTRSEKEHRLEKSVGEQVEHGRRIHADPGRHEHVAELRTGRIGDHALDVGLYQSHGRGKKGGGGPDNRNESRGLGRELHDRRHAAHQEDTRRHHGRGVNKRRDRRRAFHRVRQPGVQQQLSRLAHRADEEQHRYQIGRVPLTPYEGKLRLGQIGSRREDIVEIDAVGQEEQGENPQCEAEIPDAVDHEGLDGGGIGRGFAVIKADQQVRSDAHALPAKEHLHEIVGRHQHQHREGEEGQIGKETRLVALALFPLRVMIHVPEGIKVHEARYRGDHDQHDRGQPVEADGPVGAQAAAFDEAQDLNLFCGAVKTEEDDPAEQSRQEQQGRGQPAGGSLAYDFPAEPAKQRTDQRGKEDDGFHDLSPSSR